MELKVVKVDKDTKLLLGDALAKKREDLKAKGRLEDADEVDMFMFCLDQADEE